MAGYAYIRRQSGEGRISANEGRLQNLIGTECPKFNCTEIDETVTLGCTFERPMRPNMIGLEKIRKTSSRVS